MSNAAVLLSNAGLQSSVGDFLEKGIETADDTKLLNDRELKELGIHIGQQHYHFKEPVRLQGTKTTLTVEERARLEELAAGMTLSAYVRACVFAEKTRRRKRRPKTVVEDKKAAAEALALLGQSRIASNLNQLAHHANMGILIVDEKDKAEIAEANAHLKAIRSLLMTALGKSP